jgi:hypothetical protein
MATKDVGAQLTELWTHIPPDLRPDLVEDAVSMKIDFEGNLMVATPTHGLCLRQCRAWCWPRRPEAGDVEVVQYEAGVEVGRDVWFAPPWEG